MAGGLTTARRGAKTAVDRLPNHGPHGNPPLPGRLGEASMTLIVNQNLKATA